MRLHLHIQYKPLHLVNVVEHFLECLGNNARLHWCARHGVRLTTRRLPIGKDGPCKRKGEDNSEQTVLPVARRSWACAQSFMVETVLK